ncbi:hypothetical protein S1OALGB6SA_2293 [Olavius algarvensis spirochete endosymbiont]|nr:hypothetical protein S1OALGB6SA_2293 [Olavius algarvensis spirochete endosymbiont]
MKIQNYMMQNLLNRKLILLINLTYMLFSHRFQAYGFETEIYID